MLGRLSGSAAEIVKAPNGVGKAAEIDWKFLTGRLHSVASYELRWWACPDSNREPADYESDALTD
jgi:hypothetical protein